MIFISLFTQLDCRKITVNVQTFMANVWCPDNIAEQGHHVVCHFTEIKECHFVPRFYTNNTIPYEQAGNKKASKYFLMILDLF